MIKIHSISNMASSRFCFCFLLFFASSVIRAWSLPRNHVALFILGDSVFDPGNNNYINTLGKANYWPYGETFFKYPTGRFSDGRLISDFITEYAKLPPIPPYLQPGNHQYSYGANFASAGSGALAETSQRVMVIHMETQLRYFKNVVKLLRQNLGGAEANTILSKAVYLISFGSNDYFFRNSSVYFTMSKDEHVGMVIGNLTDTIKEIYKEGGRKFGFMNLEALGCIPIQKVFVPGNTGSCFEEANELAKLHNAALCKTLEELSIKLVGFKYANLDMNTIFSERMNNPNKYGFKEVDDMACCGSGPYRGTFSCGGKRPAMPDYDLCSNPSDYWFFDSTHLSEKANKQVAELFWSGTPNIIGPYNLKALFEEE